MTVLLKAGLHGDFYLQFLVSAYNFYSPLVPAAGLQLENRWISETNTVGVENSRIAGSQQL